MSESTAPGPPQPDTAPREWIIQRFDLDRDLDAVVALEGLCFTNPTTHEMFRREADTSDVAQAYVMRLAAPPTFHLSPPPDQLVVADAEGARDAGAISRSPSPGQPEPTAHSDNPATPPAGAVLAYCSVWLIFDEMHINTLAVHPDWRRQRLASILLTYVLADAVRQGADRATLEVRRSNEAARRLYERFGFTLGGVRPSYYRHPIEDALILWRTGLRIPIEGPPATPNSLA